MKCYCTPRNQTLLCIKIDIEDIDYRYKSKAAIVTTKDEDTETEDESLCKRKILLVNTCFLEVITSVWCLDKLYNSLYIYNTVNRYSRCSTITRLRIRRIDSLTGIDLG